VRGIQSQATNKEIADATKVVRWNPVRRARRNLAGIDGFGVDREAAGLPVSGLVTVGKKAFSVVVPPLPMAHCHIKLVTG